MSIIDVFMIFLVFVHHLVFAWLFLRSCSLMCLIVRYRFFVCWLINLLLHFLTALVLFYTTFVFIHHLIFIKYTLFNSNWFANYDLLFLFLIIFLLFILITGFLFTVHANLRGLLIGLNILLFININLHTLILLILWISMDNIKLETF